MHMMPANWNQSQFFVVENIAGADAACYQTEIMEKCKNETLISKHLNVNEWQQHNTRFRKCQPQGFQNIC